MPVVNFTWLTDASPKEVRSFEEYYGLSDPAFVEFLASLGLRMYPGSGTDKLAFSPLREETSRRGW